MSSVMDPDPLAGGSYLHALLHLTTPLAGGAVDQEVAVAPDARVRVDRPSRKPLLLAGPRAPLGVDGLRLQAAVVEADGSTTPLPPLEFAPWTEARAFLPLYRPPGADDQHRTPSLTVAITKLVEVDADGLASLPMAPEEVADRVEVRLLEGDLGRLLYVLGVEHARIRRQAREITAMRSLAAARRNALDRLGAELAVARFADHPVVDDEARVTLVPRPEPDHEYRRRLRIYRPFLLPSRGGALRVLNGPGDDADANQGPLGELGFPARLRLVEDDRPVAAAVRLFVVGPAGHRARYLQWLRAVHLVDPATDVPSFRFLPSGVRRRENQLRVRLRANADFPAGALLAPALARSLDRLGRCRAALGETTKTKVLAPLPDASASRYELNLGVDLAPLPAEELDRLAGRLADQARLPAKDPEDEQLLRTLQPLPAAVDPNGRWLLGPCGFQTVHPLSDERSYVSPLPVSGLVVEGPPGGQVPDDVVLVARHHAPRDPGDHVNLVTGMASVEAAWAAAAQEPFETLTPDAALAAYDAAQAAGAAAAAAFRASGFPEPPERPVAVTIGILLELGLLRAIRLGPKLAAATMAGEAAAVQALGRLRGLLVAAGLASAVPVVTSAGGVVLTVGLIGLPAAGLNLADRRSAGFHWRFLPLVGGAPGTTDAIENVARFTPTAEGLYAGVVLAYARRTEPDPFQVRVEAGSPGLLDFLGYEMLVNALDHVRPLGVEVDTALVRRQLVDLDGDGDARPLPAAVARSFRPYRRRPEPPPKSPEVTSVEPAEVQQGSGQFVTIRGRLLAGTTGITFDGPGMLTLVFWSTDTRVLATITADDDAPTGPRAFRVQTPRGSAESPVPFTVTTRPRVTGISPPSGRQGTSVAVTITGQGLGQATKVAFPFHPGGDIDVVNLTASDSTVKATFLINRDATDGPRQFEVQTPQGVARGDAQFEVLHRPKIFSVLPSQAHQGQDPLHLVIEGTALAGVTALEFPAGSGITAQVLAGGSDTRLPAQVTVASEAPTGARTFKVPTPLPAPLEVADSAEFGVQFTVLARPRISGIQPSGARQADPAFQAVITGTGLGGATAVEFVGGGITANVLPGGSDTAVPVQLTVARDAAAGARRFLVSVPRPTPVDRADSQDFGVAFQVTALTLSHIEPSLFTQDTRDIFDVQVTIHGTGLQGASPSLFPVLDVDPGTVDNTSPTQLKFAGTLFGSPPPATGEFKPVVKDRAISFEVTTDTGVVLRSDDFGVVCTFQELTWEPDHNP